MIILLFNKLFLTKINFDKIKVCFWFHVETFQNPVLSLYIGLNIVSNMFGFIWEPVLWYIWLNMVYSILFKKKMVHNGTWLIQTVCSNLIILDGGDLKLETDGVNMANSMVQMTIGTDGADSLLLNSELETRNSENSGIMKK